jgi:hypothetical protein
MGLNPKQLPPFSSHIPLSNLLIILIEPKLNIGINIPLINLPQLIGHIIASNMPRNTNQIQHLPPKLSLPDHLV